MLNRVGKLQFVGHIGGRVCNPRQQQYVNKGGLKAQCSS